MTRARPLIPTIIWMLAAAGCGKDPAAMAPPAATAEPASCVPRDPALLVQPAAVNLGRMPPGAGRARSIEVRAGSPRATITGSRVTGAGFTLRRGVLPGAGDEATIEIEFEGSAAIGPVFAEVLIDYDDGTAGGRTAAVPVHGAVTGDLRIPRGIYLHRRGGGFAPRKVVLTRRSGGPVHIRSVEDLDGSLTVTMLTPRGRAASFLLEVRDPHRRYDGSTRYGLAVELEDAAVPRTVIEYRIDDRGA